MKGGMLIFSLPRCGGELLTDLLASHPALRCFNEPFNPGVPDPTGRRVATPTVAGVDAVLDGVWAGWPLIEHVWDPTGWPFPKHSALNGHVLLRAARVVLLSRRNLLALAVSIIASEAERARAAEAAVGPVDAQPGPLEIAKIEWVLKQIPPALRTHRRVLYTRDRPVLDITFEQLFGAELDAAVRMQALETVFAFLGYAMSDEGVDRDRIRRGFEAARSGPGPADLWKRVSNIEEIDQRLGSDETGWLLRAVAD